MSKPQRILVTGGTGFIGRYAVERLRSQASEVVVTTSDKSPRGDADSSGLISLDLTDRAATERLIASIEPQIVLHLAGVTGVGTSADRCHAVNYLGTANLLTSLEKTDVSRVVLFGTAAEYGARTAPFREDMTVEPVSAYAVSKAKANEFALGMNARTGFPVTILRIFTAYGCGQPRKMFLSQVITHALSKQRFKMSDGLQLRDFVHVSDVVDAIVAAMSTQYAIGRVINVGQGRGIALRDVAATVWAACNADPELLEIGLLAKSGDDAFDTEADISLAAELLGWQPGTPFIGDAGPGHPLYDMIERMRPETGIDISASGLSDQAR